ncbi:structure-specific endonuclease subunit slx4 [Aspergillus floccosus]
MSAASNPIILSSSPEHIAPRAAAPTTHDSNEAAAASLRDSSPESIVSPSSLCRLPTRSCYFQKESLSDEPRMDNRPRRGTRSNSSERRGKRENTVERSISEPAAGLDGVRPPLLPQKAKAPKRRSGSNKTRGKCSKSETSTNKLLTGKVAKSGSMGSLESDKTATDASQCGPLRRKPPKPSDDGGNDHLQLEAALKRRLDWTPTKDTSVELVDASQEKAKEECSIGFGDLLAGYSFVGISSACHKDSESRSDTGPTKRRRINLVDNNPLPSKCTSNDTIAEESTEDSINSDRPSETKQRPKQRTKKFTTLTARVTARYQSDYEHSRLHAEPPNESMETANVTVPKVKRKGIYNSKRQQPEIIILSPEAAVKSLNEQDLIFGTCSQLEREESPTMIRDMQATINESEQNMASQPTNSLLQRTGESSSSISTVSRFRAPKSLWSVAARDLDGSLIDAEVVDLTESPSFKLSTGNNQITASLLPENPPTEEKRPESDAPSQPSKRIHNHDETSKPEAPEHMHRSMPDYNDFTDAALSERVTEFGFKPLKNRRRMIEILEKCWETKYGPSPYIKDTSDQQAGPASPTSHVTSARPKVAEGKARKPKRSRETTKPKTAPGSKRTKKSHTNLCATAEPTRERTKSTASRTKSNKPSSVTTYRDVEEIEDSEEEIIPSPNWLQNNFRISHSSKGTTSLSVTDNPSSPSLMPSCADSSGVDKGNAGDIPDQITRAVRAQSSRRPGTRNCPTWHEKILMYDPIILEDFTTWLNTEGLGLVREDREVNVGAVRQWCESRGICCCYRRLNRN